MYAGKTLFAQLMEFLPWTTFARIVARYGGDSGVRTLSCAEHFRVMAFAQLTYRESLRDIEACLSAQTAKLYHMGFREPIRRSTLAEANEARDWRIYAEFAQVYVGVPVGTFPVHQVRRENAHAARPARQHSELHPYLERKAPRCPRARYADPGARRYLRHGSRIYRLRPPAYVAPIRGLLCYARQIQSQGSSGLFGADRSGSWRDRRSNRRSRRSARQPRLSRASPAHPLPGPQNRQDADLSNQPVGAACPDHLRSLQKPLAGGTILQMDQATSADQAVLRHFGERGEDANLDRRLGLRAGCYRAQTAQAGSAPLHIAAGHFRHSIRKDGDKDCVLSRGRHIRRRIER